MSDRLYFSVPDECDNMLAIFLYFVCLHVFFIIFLL